MNRKIATCFIISFIFLAFGVVCLKLSPTKSHEKVAGVTFPNIKYTIKKFSTINGEKIYKIGNSVALTIIDNKYNNCNLYDITFERIIDENIKCNKYSLGDDNEFYRYEVNDNNEFVIYDVTSLKENEVFKVKLNIEIGEEVSIKKIILKYILFYGVIIHTSNENIIVLKKGNDFIQYNVTETELINSNEIYASDYDYIYFDDKYVFDVNSSMVSELSGEPVDYNSLIKCENEKCYLLNQNQEIISGGFDYIEYLGNYFLLKDSSICHIYDFTYSDVVNFECDLEKEKEKKIVNIRNHLFLIVKNNDRDYDIFNIQSENQEKLKILRYIDDNPYDLLYLETKDNYYEIYDSEFNKVAEIESTDGYNLYEKINYEYILDFNGTISLDIKLDSNQELLQLKIIVGEDSEEFTTKKDECLFERNFITINEKYYYINGSDLYLVERKEV